MRYSHHVACAGCSGGIARSGKDKASVDAAIDAYKTGKGFVAIASFKECAGSHGTPDICGACKVANAETYCPRCVDWVIGDFGLVSPDDDATFTQIQNDMAALKSKIEG